MTPKLYWEDFPAGCARRIGPRRVSAEEIVTFARQFDPQPFHVDAESAASGHSVAELETTGMIRCRSREKIHDGSA
jgi:acyl dehydratase